MSLKVPPQWLAAPVSLYATRKKTARPRPRKPSIQIEYLGRYGARHEVVVRDAGKPRLRYLTDEQLAELRAASHPTGNGTGAQPRLSILSGSSPS